MSFYNQIELEQLGFKSLGENVLLSKKASIYNATNIELGSNVRIDDFCILSAGKDGIVIGNHVHVACYSSLIGDGKIEMKDFSGLSSRVSIYSSNDDYSGAFLTNPCVPDEFTNVSSAPVSLEKHVIIGCGTIILPGVNVGEGSAIGAQSLVSKSCEANYIYAGSPLKKLKIRKNGYRALEKSLLNQ